MYGRRFLALAGICVLALWPGKGYADAARQVPTFTVQVKAINDLRDDAKYLARLAGHGDQAAAVDGMLNTMIADKGLLGFDVRRPLGMYGVINKDTLETAVVAVLPVVDEKTILNELQEYGLKAEKGEDGIYAVSGTGFVARIPVYFRFAGAYVYVTAQNKAALDKEQMLAAEQILANGPSGLVDVVVRIDQLPEAAKQLVLGEVETKLAEEQARAEGKRGARRGCEEASRAAARAAAKLINEAAEIRVKANVDRKAGALVVEVQFTGRSGTELKARIAELGHAQSWFAGLGSAPETAFRLLARGTLPQEAARALAAGIREAHSEPAKNEMEKEWHQAARTVAEALEPTLASGELDFGAAIRGPWENNHYTLIAGLRVKDGKKVEEAMRRALERIPEEKRKRLADKIHWDAETVEGASVTRIETDQLFDAGARQRWGDAPFYLGVRDDALFIAGGEKGMAALKEALALSPRACPQFELEIAAARWAPFIAARAGMASEEARKAAAQTFPAGSADRLRVTAEGGEALTLRCTVNAKVVSFFRELRHHRKRADEPGAEKREPSDEN